MRKFLLLTIAGGFALNCSGKPDDSTPALNSAAGSTSGASSSSGTGGASAGSAGANSAGSGGASSAGSGGGMGRPPVNGMCVASSTKHTDGLCYCQPASLTYCADACADLATDADHCGDCATKCEETQGCGASKCGATPATLVPAAAGCGTIRLALSGANLYWTEELSNKVKWMAVAGAGTPTEITNPGMTPGLIQSNGTTAFWVAKGDKSIRKSVAGAAATIVVPGGAGEIDGLALSADGKTVFYTYTVRDAGRKVIGSPTIFKVADDGTNKLEVGHEDSGVPHALAVEGALIAFPTELNGDVDVMTIGETPAVCASMDSTTAVNKNCTRISQSQAPNYEGMYVISGKAYWSNMSAVNAKSATDASANAVIVGSADQANKITAFAISNDTLFFAGDEPSGNVYRTPLSGTGTAATAIARKQVGVSSLVANATTAYWATAACAIVSVSLGSGVAPL